MKTIGVLGGLGPQATMDFEVMVHRVAQQLIAPDVNGGYPPMVVFYYRFAPLLSNDAAEPEFPLRPDPRFLRAASQIGAVADFLVVTSNFLHVFRAEIEQAAGCSVLSMIDLAVGEAQRRGWRRIGVPGFGDPIVYTQQLAAAGIEAETITGESRARLDDAVRRVMEGRENESSVRSALEALDELRARDIDGIILGCTEIPLLLGERANAEDLINPLQLLAESAVRYALE